MISEIVSAVSAAKAPELTARYFCRLIEACRRRGTNEQQFYHRREAYDRINNLHPALVRFKNRRATKINIITRKEVQ